MRALLDPGLACNTKIAIFMEAALLQFFLGVLLVRARELASMVSLPSTSKASLVATQPDKQQPFTSEVASLPDQQQQVYSGKYDDNNTLNLLASMP